MHKWHITAVLFKQQSSRMLTITILMRRVILKHLAWPSLCAAPVMLCLSSLHKPQRNALYTSDIHRRREERSFMLCAQLLCRASCKCMSCTSSLQMLV